MCNPIHVHTRQTDSYKIHIGSNLLDEAARFCTRYSKSVACIIIDENVQELHGERIASAFNEYFSTVHTYVVAAGEQSKSMDEYSRMMDFVLGKGVTRSTPLIAIGGGVTGDLGGYVAATALRGIPLIQIPTTLLAMVDSSIGGKTGINHRVGKNLVGSFYQPKSVFSDLNFLDTLSEREWINGISEIIKYAAIKDPAIIKQIAGKTLNRQSLLRSGWQDIVHKSAQIKVDIVQHDTLEAGIRAYLNFGHTFAHAIENIAGYGKFAHGEAVFAGMIAAAHVSNKLGGNIKLSNFLQFKPLYSFSLKSFQHKTEDLIQKMYSDKKVTDGNLRLIVLKEMGEPSIIEMNDTELLTDVWNLVISEFS